MLTRATVLLAVSTPLIVALPQDPPVSSIVPRAPLSTGSPPSPPDKVKEVKCADESQGAMWIPNVDEKETSTNSRVGFEFALMRACGDLGLQLDDHPDLKHVEISVQEYIKQAGVVTDVSQCPKDDPSTTDVDESIGAEMDFSKCYQVWLSDGIYGKLQLSADISAGGSLDFESCFNAVYGAFNPDQTDKCAGGGRPNFNGKDTLLGTVLMESGAYYAVNATRL